MSKNIEIKARIRDSLKLRENISLLEISHHSVLMQHDSFFYVPFGRLKVRHEGERGSEVIYYVRPDSSGPKSSWYVRVNIRPWLAVMLRPFVSLWPRLGDVKKRRELFIVDSTRIHVDDVDGLGKFLEFEVVLRPEDSISHGHAVATSLLNRLNIDSTDLVEGAYIDLLRKPSHAH